MSLPSALSGETYNTSVRSSRSPAKALRTRRSMQARNAVSVLPEPVGAEISVVWPARMCGQPCSWGSVGVPKRATNHSWTSGCAQESDSGMKRAETSKDTKTIVAAIAAFVNCSPLKTYGRRRRIHEFIGGVILVFKEKAPGDSPALRFSLYIFRIPKRWG